MSFNLATILTETALATPDAPVCKISGTTTSYRELDELSGRVAAGLRSAGLSPGQVVALQLPNIPQFLIAYFGALKAGLVVLPLNPLLMAPEIEYHLTDSSAALLVGFEGLHAEAAKACELTGTPFYLVSMSQDPLPEGARSVLELFSMDPLEEPGGDVTARDADDTAVLVYTSGTTGKPKGAELTHFQLYMNCTVAGELFGVKSDDVVLAVLPFFHVFGLSSVVNVFVRRGGCLSVLPRFVPVQVLDAMEADRVTVIGGVPTMLHALAREDITGRDLSALRVAVSGGASLPEDVMRTFEDKYGIEVLEGYGMTETAASCSFNRPGEKKVLSIGKPMWGVRMRVCDPHGKALPAGREHVGEIHIKGHNVMKGYLGRPEATAEALVDGWLHTGDLVTVNGDDLYTFVARKKEVIRRRGENLSPAEVEEAVAAHPAVLECAVVGVPSELTEEEVKAFVVLREPVELEALREFAAQRLTSFKVPRFWQVLDDLPRTPTSRVAKHRLPRERTSEEYDAG
jgi:long-chain acyl-CoA synthetase